MKFLRLIIFNLLVLIVPLLIVIYSISYQSGQVDTYQKPIANAELHNNISQEVNTSDYNFADSKSVITNIITSAILEDIATKEWVDNLTEENIELFTQWWNNDKDDMYVYFAAEQTANKLVENIDSKVDEMAMSHGVQVCEQSQIDEIKRVGFDDQSSFCLPETVINGQTTLSQYFDFTPANIYGEMFHTSPINTNQELFLVSSFADNNITEFLTNRLEDIKNIKNWIVGMFWYTVIATILAILALVLIAKIRGKSIIKEMSRLFQRLGFVTLLITSIIFGIAWASSYITKLSDALSDDIQEKIIGIITSIGFNLVSIAFWIGFWMTFASIVMWFVKRFFLRNINTKNKKIKKHVQNLDQANSTAFDGEFKKAVAQDNPTKYIIEDNVTKENFEDLNKTDNVDFNDDEVPDNFKKEYYDQSMDLESDPDPDITKPNTESGYDYNLPK